MKELFEFYFEMFDTILDNQFNGIVDEDFIAHVNEIKNKLKNTLMESEDFNQVSEVIDKNFMIYIKAISES